MKVKFKPPAAFVMPEGKKDGDRFSALAEFKMDGDKLCLIGIDGNDLPGHDESKDSDSEGKSKTEIRYNTLMDSNNA